MNRAAKIALLKEVAKGNYARLQAIQEEQNKSVVSVDNIILCFYYLLEHGRPSGYQAHMLYEDCCITSAKDLQVIENGLTAFGETNSFENVSLEALNNLMECMECYRVLKERNELHYLKPYQQKTG